MLVIPCYFSVYFYKEFFVTSGSCCVKFYIIVYCTHHRAYTSSELAHYKLLNVYCVFRDCFFTEILRLLQFFLTVVCSRHNTDPLGVIIARIIVINLKTAHNWCVTCRNCIIGARRDIQQLTNHYLHTFRNIW